MAGDFDQFWSRYPKRVGKLAALKAYQKALSVATADEILAGVEEYRKHMPEDAQYIPMPATFLNQGRWMDEYPDKIDTRAAYKPYIRLADRKESA